jgi:hypothetical protein
VCIAGWKGGHPGERPKMTMLNNTSSHSVTTVAFRRSLRFFAVRLTRRINDWVAATIARRERQAQLTCVVLATEISRISASIVARSAKDWQKRPQIDHGGSSH